MTIIPRYVAFLERRGRVVLIIAALVIIGALFGVTRMEIVTNFEVFMPRESEYIENVEAMTDSFGDAGQLVVLARIPGPDEPNRLNSLIQVEGLPEVLQRISGVESAQGPLPKPGSSAQTGERRGLDELADAVEQAQRLSSGSAFPSSGDEHYAAFRLLLSSAADKRQTVRDAEEAFRAAGLEPVVSGEPYLEAKIFDYILRVLITLPPVAIVLMLGVFRIRIGSSRATILSMVPAVVGAALTLGGMGWLQGSVSTVSVLVPLFVIVLGSADGLHVTSHIMDSLAEGLTSRQAVERTLRTVGVPIILTTLTTMAGFLSLLVVNSGAFQAMGVTAAIGILIAGIATWIILPPLLLRLKPLVRRRNSADGVLVRAFVRLRGWPSLVIAVALVGTMIPGALSLRANSSMIDVYRSSTDVRQSIDTTARVLGGAIPVYVTFPAEEQFDPATARAILELQDECETSGIATRSLSAYSVVAAASEQATGNPGYPEQSVLVRTVVLRMRMTSPSLLDSFFSDDGQGRSVFFLRDLGGETLQAFIDIVAGVSERSGVELKPVGTAFVIKEMNDQIIPQQLGSLLVAVAIVFALTALSQRSIKLGVLATIPILLTLVALFGVMGYVGINLSIVTGIMTGLTVGVGIDYAIHYVSMYRERLHAGERDVSSQSGSRDCQDSMDKRAAAASSAHSFVATPILANAMGLTVGFTAMILSPLQIHVNLSILIWVTMIASAVLSLTLLPTLASGSLRRQS